MHRRSFLQTAAATAVGSFATPSALARTQPDPPGSTPPPRNWNDPASVVYPDPAIEAFDPRFRKYVVGTTEIRRLWTGGEWTEGPVYFGDMHSVIFGDVPNNRMLRYDEVTGETTLFRYPSNEANGNTRDRQGRLVTCEQRTRRVTRKDGNLWSAGGWSPDKNFNGVSVFAPDSTPIGRIVLPEVAANLCFGGYQPNRSRLYICASTSLYSVYVGVRGLGV